MNQLTDQASSATANVVELAADIVAAYVSKNAVPMGELSALIASVHGALQSTANPTQAKAEEKPTPAVPVKKSITPDAIISLIDGKPYKSMKRHLARHGMTPAQYRERYDLPRDYPVVAANYAAKRSELAKSLGLGQHRQRAAAKTADTGETVSSEKPKKRSRKKSA
jgi:predicted transcriptional regulator